MDKNSEYRKIFRDIVRGYSLLINTKTPYYAKHLTVQDQVDLDEIYSHHYKKAQNRGLPTEGEASLDLKEQGLWTEEEDKEIFQKELYIKNLIQTKKSLVLKSHIDKQNELIGQEQELLDKIQIKKKNLMGITCETYASAKVNYHYIIISIYLDCELKSMAFN